MFMLKSDENVEKITAFHVGTLTLEEMKSEYKKSFSGWALLAAHAKPSVL